MTGGLDPGASIDYLTIDEVARFANYAGGTVTEYVYELSQNSLKFAVQPSDVLPGATMTPPVKVQVLGSTGTPDASYKGSVTLALDNASGTQVSTLGTQSVAGGVATFSNLRVNQAGQGYTLVATSGILSVTSAKFTVGPKLTVTKQPPTNVLAADDPDAGFGLTVTATAPGGKPLANLPLTLSLANDPSGGSALLGPPTELTATTDSNGQASFKGLTVDTVGDGYTLKASTTGANPVTVTTTPFNVVDQLPVDVRKAGGKTHNWSEAANWSLGVPQDGESLQFPAVAASFTSINDLTGLVVDTIEIDGSYQIRGAAINLVTAMNVTAGDSNFAVPTYLAEAIMPAVEPRDNPPPAPTVTANVSQDATVSWQNILQSPGILTLTGMGTVKTHVDKDGGTVLEAGTLVIANETVGATLGTGPFTVMGTATLYCLNPVFLSNDVNVKVGSILSVTGSPLTLTGNVVATDASDGTNSSLYVGTRVTLTNSLTGTLAIIGPSGAALASTSSGAVALAPTFNGVGNFFLGNGGTLQAGGVGQNNDAAGKPIGYSGTITLNGGTLKLGGKNPLDEAKLDLPSGNNGVLDGVDGLVLANEWTELNGTLQAIVSGKATIKGPIAAANKAAINTSNGTTVLFATQLPSGGGSVVPAGGTIKTP